MPTTIYTTIFTKPHGKSESVEMKNIHESDAKYINEHNIKVSMEEGKGGDIIIYFDDGKKEDDGVTPKEIIIISSGRTCEECMAEGVAKIKNRN